LTTAKFVFIHVIKLILFIIIKITWIFVKIVLVIQY